MDRPTMAGSRKHRSTNHMVRLSLLLLRGKSGMLMKKCSWRDVLRHRRLETSGQITLAKR